MAWQWATQALVSCFLKGGTEAVPAKGSADPCMGSEGSFGRPYGAPLGALIRSGVGAPLSLKMVFPLAIASAKRVSELRALSVHPACLRLGGEGFRHLSPPEPGIPAEGVALLVCSETLSLDPFHPPPHKSLEAARLHLVCLVRALRSYIARTRSIRQTDQLFVCF